MPSPLDQPDSSIPEQTPDENDQKSPEPIANPRPLAIEHKSADSTKQPEAEQVHSLDLGAGNVVKLDRLGPMIVNTDGTLSRISNWHELSEFEQERTVRLLVKKRNLVRLEKLDEKERAEGRAAGDELSALRNSQADEKR